jgi:NAD(P)-dependent dehydrogenase (short-subunit alcohol dehydrogenase family)
MSSPKEWTLRDIPDLNDKIAIVTGANTGLGFEDARYLSRKDATVVMGCRDLEKGASAKQRILNEGSSAKLDLMKLDLASLSSIKDFSTAVQDKYDRIDILINNAGVMFTPFSRTEDGFELQFGTNHLGHFALTGLLLPSIVKAKNSRIISVSSVAARDGIIDFEDINFEKRKYDGRQAYSQSKLACLLFALELNDRLKENGYSTISLCAHPGFSRTELLRYSSSSMKFLFFFMSPFSMSSESGSRFALYAATAPEAKGRSYYGPDSMGQMRGDIKEIDLTREPSAKWITKENKSRLWEISEEMTKIRYL